MLVFLQNDLETVAIVGGEGDVAFRLLPFFQNCTEGSPI